MRLEFHRPSISKMDVALRTTSIFGNLAITRSKAIAEVITEEYLKRQEAKKEQKREEEARHNYVPSDPDSGDSAIIFSDLQEYNH